MFRYISSVVLICFVLSFSIETQAQFKNLLNKADSSFKSKKSTNQGQSSSSNSSSFSKPSLPEMSDGIKQALEKGLKDGVNQVSAPDGFLKNMSIKLLFPPEAKKAEQTLRSLGMNQLCDNVILTMNRAAEDASKKAVPIFMNALRHMSVQDAEGILTGPDNSATEYFRKSTKEELLKAFRPVVDSSLHKVNATKYYGDAANTYNKTPFVKKINPDLTEYATEKATEGLFITIAQEELKIRTQTGARSSPVMQKVFGYFQK